MAVNVPGEDQPLTPVLQNADGTYVGTVSSQGQSLMAGFDLMGNVIWTVLGGYTPVTGTSDGGLIA